MNIHFNVNHSVLMKSTNTVDSLIIFDHAECLEYESGPG